MTANVTIVDYGVGNILSVSRALEKVGAHVTVSSDADEISNAERLVLPGVGAFGHALEQLQNRNLEAPVKNFANNGRPFLGICVGMQLMMTLSTEYGHHQGLDLVAGNVVKIPNMATNGERLKIPHVGWNRLEPGPGHDDRGTILEGLPKINYVYFVHSYTVEPENQGAILATCSFGGHSLVAVVRSGNAYGCQFHPEKSGETGLSILQQFLNI